MSRSLTEDRHNGTRINRAIADGDDRAAPPAKAIARIKPVAHGADEYFAICGFVSTDGKTCSQRLGTVTRASPLPGSGPGDVAAALSVELGAPPPKAWVMTAPPEFCGFDQLSGGGYQVIRTRRERDRYGQIRRRMRGRRDAPSYVWEAAERSGLLSHQPSKAGKGNYDIIGSIPSLPALITCPLCGRLNRVESPTDAERGGTRRSAV